MAGAPSGCVSAGASLDPWASANAPRKAAPVATKMAAISRGDTATPLLRQVSGTGRAASAAPPSGYETA